MEISREARIRMERAHVHAWPALRTAKVDGWLWRSSGGGSRRANSTSTIDFAGTDPEAAVAAAEARYAAEGKPAIFQTFDETAPPGLAAMLRSRGYRELEATVTMFKPNTGCAGPANLEVRDQPWDEWLAVYLEAITESRRVINQEILRQVPAPRAFFGARRDGRIVSTALCVVAFGCAVVECVATESSYRRQGAARDALFQLECWVGAQDAGLLGLQVVAGNHAAIALYESLGFVAGATNRFWQR